MCPTHREPSLEKALKRIHKIVTSFTSKDSSHSVDTWSYYCKKMSKKVTSDTKEALYLTATYDDLVAVFLRQKKTMKQDFRIANQATTAQC